MLYFSIPISPFGPFADCCYQLVEDDPRNGARKTLRVNFDEKRVVVFKEVRAFTSSPSLVSMGVSKHVISTVSRSRSR